MLPRHLLPQIPENEFENFIKYASDNDIDAKMVKIPAGKIHPIQKHLSKKKLKKMMKEKITGTPLIVSNDNRLMDGHHRWAAVLLTDPKQEIICVKFDCSMTRLLLLGHTFQAAEVRSIDEALFIE